MNPLSPFTLQSQITVLPGGGEIGLADSTKLENPWMAPMWIDEIRFRLPDSIGAPGGGDAAFWANLRVKLVLGNLSLTNGAVPISLLGKVLNDSFGGFNNIGEAAPDKFTWKLPKPLYIPARALLRPTMYYEPGSIAADPKTVTIIYACRPIARGTPDPKVFQIPWVSYFKPPYMVATQTPVLQPLVDVTDQSTPSDIFNPFDQDLHVQRFIGRLMHQNTGAEEDGFMSLASANVDLVASGAPVIVGTLISAQDSMNNILIRDRTPFAHVFDFLDRAWTVNCTLPSKGFYLFTIDRLWAAYTINQLSATVGISMVGWREVGI